MLGIGLKQTSNISGIPLLSPPLIPPEWFVTVFPPTAYESFIALPRAAANRKPSPNEIPCTPGTEKTMWEMTLSMLSKNGSPTPTGIPRTAVSTLPPTLSPQLRTCANSHSKSDLMPLSMRGKLRSSLGTSFMSGSNGASSTLPIRFICDTICMSKPSKSCRASAPAKTNAAVILPENAPPPRGSLNPLNFSCAA